MKQEQPLGTLYMVPVPIADGAIASLSGEALAATERLRYYFVENARTARRAIRAMHAKLVLEEIQFSEIDKHAGPDKTLLRKWLKEGHDIGVMSEAGCPGVADPGAELAAVAQDMGAAVHPLTGPSSLLLALMASGLNGQSFAFIGYLPVKEPMRSKRIKELELRSRTEKQTQLFIETPYRNDQLLTDLLKNCISNTRICIARNVSGADAWVKTRTAADWLKNKPVLGKEPVVFLVLAV